MTQCARAPALDLAGLLPSWELALRAERKSAPTVKSYGDGARSFLRWCENHHHSPALDRNLVKAWVADLLDAGAEPATARSRQLGLRRFSARLEEEGEVDADPLLGLKAPRLDSKVVESLSDDELIRLIKACAGKEFRDRRDEAIVQLRTETGMRAGELIGLTVPDVDLAHGVLVVRRGKGGRGRIAPYGPHTARAIDRYLRARRTHRLADPALVGGSDDEAAGTNRCRARASPSGAGTRTGNARQPSSPGSSTTRRR